MNKTLLLLLILFTHICHAQQWDFGGGAYMAAPLIYNNQVGNYHHSARSVGGEYTMRYLPANLSFYPQLNLSISGNEIPLIKFDDIVVQMYLLQMEATLSVRLVYNIDERKEIHYGMGLGGIHYESEGVSVALKGNSTGYYGNSSNEISGWLPTVNISGEYIMKISATKPVYCGIGARLGYTYFSNATATVNAGISTGTSPYTQVTVGPKGNMVTPLIHLAFYYRLGERLY